MRIENLQNFTKGWIIGNFVPTLLDTKDFELALKQYVAGESEKRHVHKVATEYTILMHGSAIMNGKTVNGNDIVVLEPGESTDFYAITDVLTIVIKTPSVIGDKYVLE